ncbi:hypothetical protein JD844_003563 [Phrynosoma platyrhinos]|uniref:Beta/gamma crystallin 'Greek key' domain-containing protein n=1 Tax=Phrynosoma platyrhinos TaxID=52577 RepID=A0ABQ7TDB7_PHRPL|nr:hypothetical protein JD844_003563 [Phrynosoma platyrhinos]
MQDFTAENNFFFFFKLILSYPYQQHGEHYRIEVYEGRHFRGRSQEFTEDCSYLSRQGWAKNWINAIKVYGDGA